MAVCHFLGDAKYIDTYDLEILKTSVSQKRLEGEIFEKLVTLRNLDISHGEIEQIDSDAFRKLLNLRSLDLSHNKITSLPSKLFDNLKKLRSLNLRHNLLVKIPDAVLAVKSLKTLDLAGNRLNCNCATLKARDLLVARHVHLSKRILCASPPNLKNRPLLDLEADVICRFEEQDKEMQMDQPEGSGEASPIENSDDPVPEETDKEVSQEVPVDPTTEEIETPAPEQKSTEPEDSSPVPSATSSSPSSPETNEPLETSSTNDAASSVTEEKDKLVMSPTTPASVKSTADFEENEEDPEDEILPGVADEEKSHPVEGSGEADDLNEGSGIEGSGTGVPPISWDVPEEEVAQETSSVEPDKATDSSLLDMFLGVFWSTPAAPEDEKKKELDPEDEEFINVSSEATPIVTEKTAVHEDVIVPVVIEGRKGSATKSEGTSQAGAVEVDHILDEARSGKVKAEDSVSDAEATDASATRQPKKGMGSYVVLAALLAVLGILIGFAAYKGDFCRKKRNRNDPENGTELKDMTKSLLDAGNGNQPKISSNGNLENVPLVSTPQDDDSKLKDHKNDRISDSLEVSKTRYSGMAPDVVDPLKPPRKSYAPHDETEGTIQNGKSHQDLTKTSSPTSDTNEPVFLRSKSANQPVTNGKNHHDSVSSLGTESRDSPSIRTSPRVSSPANGSLGTLQALARPPLSPGAQRVKITLTENPDSVPRTPILITRTKTGENLVKTP